jgi:SpoVK/Ycf46/Vps4 family AAA+-type ATPase
LKDVAGLHRAKRALREAIVLPLMRPDLFTGSRQPWRGILLHGPPGCGKTMIAKATAGDIDATFFNISAATLVSKYLGESEKLVKKLYEMAKEKQPSIIFIDEVDSLTQSRGDGEHDAMRRVKTQLLTSMEGIASNKEDRVVTIGATNVPWEIDSAFRRRFQKRIYVPLPDIEAREVIFKVNSKGIELDDSVNFNNLAEISQGYSGSDIANICRDAVMSPIRELDSSDLIHDKNISARAVVQSDYETAIEGVSKSVSGRELVRFEKWNEEFGAE